MQVERLPNTDFDIAFRPSLIRQRFVELCGVGYESSEAYELTRDLCRRDLTYYFLEQFAKKRLVNFEYNLVRDTCTGEAQMVSAHYEQFGDVCDLYAKAVLERKEKGRDCLREEAELEGMVRVRNTIAGAQEETAVLLISPPPDADEGRKGYADYSFVYFGLYSPLEGKLQMHAWRNNMTLSEQNALYRQFTNEDVLTLKVSPCDFLRDPAFRFGADARRGYEQLLSVAGQAADFWEYRELIDQAAGEIVEMAADGASDEMLNLAMADVELEFIKTLEEGKRYAKPVFDLRVINVGSVHEAYQYLALKRDQIAAKYDLFSYQAGGCGASVFSLSFGRAENLNMLGVSVAPDLLLSDNLGEFFNCPKCRGKIESGKGVTTCPHCGYTKEEAARETGVSCD